METVVNPPEIQPRTHAHVDHGQSGRAAEDARHHSAIADAKGTARVAEAALELSAEGADAYLRWLEDR